MRLPDVMTSITRRDWAWVRT